MTACTTTPNAKTNNKKGTLTARRICGGVVRRCSRLRTASADAPASAAQAGAIPTASATAKPINVNVTTMRTNTGGRGAGPASGSGAARRSRAKNQRKTTYTVRIVATHGSAISKANLVNDKSAVW